MDPDALPDPQFVSQVADAYEHLYDLVALRAHALARLLVVDPGVSQKERGWQLHRALLQAVDELDPGPRAPAFSVESRRHQLMVLRFVDGLDPQAVADRLAISRRHFYREQEVALLAVARVLSEALRPPPSADTGVESDASAADPEHLDLLRVEADRSAHPERFTDLDEVLRGVLPLLQARLAQRMLETTPHRTEDLPRIALDRGLLRQIVLTMLSYVVERAQAGRISVSARAAGSLVVLQVEVEDQELAEDLAGQAGLRELAKLAGAFLRPLPGGLALSLPAAAQRSVLIVDDNEDTLELMARYLAHHGYAVVKANNAGKALALAKEVRPYAVTLDLMLPEQDGWEVLQALRNHPETQETPVIVCSVLHARELALSLGAAAFLPKPVSEEALLAALDALAR